MLASSPCGLEPAVAARVAQAAAPPSGAPPGPDTMFDIFVPGDILVGAPGPSGVVPGVVPGVGVAVPVAQVAGS